VREERRIKRVATVKPATMSPGATAALPIEVRVEPLALPLTDPLARVDGVMHALTLQTDTVREVTIIGPGAGPEQAGQGMFSDLLAVISRIGASARPPAAAGTRRRRNPQGTTRSTG
jgi:homoserine dehydrogenase